MEGSLAGVVNGVLQAVGEGSWRAVAPRERGLTLEVGGWPLEIGVAWDERWLRVQAEACGPGRVDPHWLLHRNRLGLLARATHTSHGAVWVQAELPCHGLTAELLDETLARVVDLAGDVRAAARG